MYRAGEAPRTPAARPDRPRIKPSSVILLSFLFSPLLFAFFLVGDRGFLEVRRQREKLKTLQTEVAALDAGNRKLADEVEALRKEPEAAEKIAREQLGLVAPGDVVVVLPPDWREKVTPKKPPIPVRPATAAAR